MSLCVSVCLYVLVCVVFVASVLASMRWLLCGGDRSKKTKTTSVITEKYPARELFHYSLKLIRKNITASNYTHYSLFIRKKFNLHHVKSVIIFGQMVCARSASGCLPCRTYIRRHPGKGRGMPSSRPNCYLVHCPHLKARPSLPLESEA